MSAYKYSDAVVLIFAKAPVAGEVNTRLIPDIGIEAATELQRELVMNRLNILRQHNLCVIQLWCAPNQHHEFFQDCKNQYAIELFDQHGVDLGARMSSAIKQNLNKFKRVVLIGTDAPSLTNTHIDTAIKQLAENDIVIAPAEDGGYVLIGMSRHCHDVFDEVEWGSSTVLETTRERIKRNNLTSFEIEMCWDIDRVEDYFRYKKSQSPNQMD
ncbi:MAG: TIGR04282 family arsenosugar biosynthesis glycosyltransferase [Gammaproteobacteria bacterium]|nr:TIGR04282 family arsenosugar biosynthesis glycosyltransferase [Gammaproteobacteria bacterium]